MIYLTCMFGGADIYWEMDSENLTPEFKSAIDKSERFGSYQNSQHEVEN